MTENKDDPSDIAQRLEKLNQWQEEQKQILFERQNNQRKLLGLEHRKMYEMLGIFHTETLEDEQESVDEFSEDETSCGVCILDKTADEEQTSLSNKDSQQPANPKKTFLRRKQGLITRFKIDPDKLRLNNLPPYTFSSTHPSLKQKKCKKTKTSKEKPAELKKKDSVVRPLSKTVLKLKNEKYKNYLNIDTMEEKFQKSLISSTTACNSTPDVKSQSSSMQETLEAVVWAKILDPQDLKPIEIQTSSQKEKFDETDNLDIFELLEKKAQEGSFDLNSSCIKRFLSKTQKGPDERNVESAISTKLPPIPYEVYHNSKSIDSDSTDTDDDVDEEEEQTISSRGKNHVHFADTSETEKPSQNISDVQNITDASQAFEDFKKLIFANQSQTTLNESGSGLAQEILQKADLIKERLHELESEIAVFKENNLELVKSKQEHELEKAHFEQERQEWFEKINDEKIQMEIYLHDERMKIEDDRKKTERQMRNQKLSTVAKEKKEIAKLREEIESLQKELKKKEESHIAAQSRLRAQVRNLEKDVRQLNLDIDALNKENKRLESENLKINRQNNNKMLQEINRNIAKLAPNGPLLTHADEKPLEKLSTKVSQQYKQKQLTRRRSAEIKRKPSPIKRKNSPVATSDEDCTSGSSEEPDYTPSKVTFAKSPPQRNRNNSTENVETLEPPKESADASFKREISNPDGSKDIWYPNGNLKKISADGMIIRMLYFNKDIKETNINEGIVKYYYAETNTWHTTYLDGLEILEFPNGQTEHRYKDGRIEIHFPNNSIKITNPSDENKLEEWRFVDGTNLTQMKNGDKILLLPNGQKEIHTALSKRREYPDGTVKLVYPDGSQETRYSNGRVRLKDKDGVLVMDTVNLNTK